MLLLLEIFNSLIYIKISNLNLLHFKDIYTIMSFVEFEKRGKSKMNNTLNKKDENLLFIAWIASFISTLGSLYFSEVMKFVPCDLCWYQRIFMYPLVILLGIAYVKKDATVTRYSIILSAIGGMISIYHYSIQKVAFLGERSFACGRVPCTGEYINWLGFITIPFLALIGFTIIFICSLFIIRNKG